MTLGQANRRGSRRGDVDEGDEEVSRVRASKDDLTHWAVFSSSVS